MTPRRSSKRTRLSIQVNDSSDQEDEEDEVTPAPASDVEPNDDFGGYTWECVAVTHHDYSALMSAWQRTRDPNEKQLKARIEREVLPIVEKRAEAQQRKFLRQQKELENMQKLATAKRSGRIAGKMERQRELDLAAEAERKRKDDLIMARKEEERQRKLEEASTVSLMQ